MTPASCSGCGCDLFTVVADANKWTTEPPTENGYYWAKAIDFEQIVDMVLIWGGTIRTIGGDEWGAGDFTHWLGPLPVPEVPK